MRMSLARKVWGVTLFLCRTVLIVGMFAVQAFKLTAQVIDTGGQIRHNAGQAVVPVYEGWFEDSNGDIQVAFGYLNRNYDCHL